MPEPSPPSDGRPTSDADGRPDPHPLDSLRLDPPGPAERLEELWLLARQRPFVALAVLAGAGVALLVGAQMLRSSPTPVEDSLPVISSPPTATASTSPSTAPEAVVVHAAGAVLSPGVYELPAGSRLGDLVDAAGGLTADADPDRVNLAATLVDGARIWVPRKGEVEPPDVVADVAPPPGGEAGPAGDGRAGDGVVDVNRADAAELETLPGIGPVTAQAIISHREEHGPFASIDDLLDVRGIGEAKLAQVRDLVTL